MSYYDSSSLTKRLQNKTIADGYIKRIQQNNQSGYGSTLGVYDDSIINNIKMGQMPDVAKRDGCTTVNSGCPCQPTPIIIPPVQCGDTLPSWLAPITSSSSGNNRTTEQYSIYYDCDSVYTAGRFSNTSFLFNPNSSPNSPELVFQAPANDNAGTLIKYNNKGELQWLARASGPSSTDNPNIAITGDDTGIYMAGYFQGTINFFNGSLLPNTLSSVYSLGSANSGSVPSTYIAKYSKSGQFLWATKIDNGIGQANTGDNYWNLASDGENIYLAWRYEITTCILYNKDTTQALTLTSSSTSPTPLIVKYSKDGNLVWAIDLPGSTTTMNGWCMGICVNSSGIYVNAVMFSTDMEIYEANTLPLGPSTTSVILTKGVNNWGTSILIKYDKDGKFQWATNTISTNNGGAYTRTITCDEDNVYFGGNFNTNTLNVYNATLTGTGSTIIYSLLVSFNNDIGYVLSYDAITGDAKWGFSIENSSNDGNQIKRLMSDGEHLYITGIYNNSNSVRLYSGNSSGNTTPQSAPITNSGGSDIYLAKYTKSGQLLWVTKIAANFDDVSYGLFSNKDFVYLASNSNSLVNYYNAAADLADPTSIGISYSPTIGSSKFTTLVKYTVNGTLSL